jgi:hypothetical protein
MQELLIANPRPKRRRKMSALQRKYFGKRKRSTSHKRKSRAVKVTRVSINPRPRRRSSSRAVVVSRPARRRSPRRYARAITYRARKGFGGRVRSTGLKIAGLIPDKIIPAMVGAGGALLIDMGWGYIPIPAALQTGPLAPLTRIAAILAAGYLAKFVAGEKYAQEFTVGGLTVTIYDLAKTWMQTNVPSVPLSAFVGGMGYVNPARFSPMGAFVGGYGDEDEVYEGY